MQLSTLSRVLGVIVVGVFALGLAMAQSQVAPPTGVQAPSTAPPPELDWQVALAPPPPPPPPPVPSPAPPPPPPPAEYHTADPVSSDTSTPLTNAKAPSLGQPMCFTPKGTCQINLVFAPPGQDCWCNTGGGTALGKVISK